MLTFHSFIQDTTSVLFHSAVVVYVLVCFGIQLIAADEGKKCIIIATTIPQVS